MSRKIKTMTNAFTDKLNEIKEHWKAKFPQNHDLFSHSGFAEGFIDGMVQKTFESIIIQSPLPNEIEALFIKARVTALIEHLGDAKAERAFLDDIVAACDVFIPAQTD
jgi:hypothetical protein